MLPSAWRWRRREQEEAPPFSGSPKVHSVEGVLTGKALALKLTQMTMDQQDISFHLRASPQRTDDTGDIDDTHPVTLVAERLVL